MQVEDYYFFSIQFQYFRLLKKRSMQVQFDAHKLINFSGADYLPDNDEFLMFFLDRLHCQRLVSMHRQLTSYFFPKLFIQITTVFSFNSFKQFKRSRDF